MGAHWVVAAGDPRHRDPRPIQRLGDMHPVARPAVAAELLERYLQHATAHPMSAARPITAVDPAVHGPRAGSDCARHPRHSKSAHQSTKNTYRIA